MRRHLVSAFGPAIMADCRRPRLGSRWEMATLMMVEMALPTAAIAWPLAAGLAARVLSQALIAALRVLHAAARLPTRSRRHGAYPLLSSRLQADHLMACPRRWHCPQRSRRRRRSGRRSSAARRRTHQPTRGCAGRRGARARAPARTERTSTTARCIRRRAYARCVAKRARAAAPRATRRWMARSSRCWRRASIR